MRAGPHPLVAPQCQGTRVAVQVQRKGRVHEVKVQRVEQVVLEEEEGLREGHQEARQGEDRGRMTPLDTDREVLPLKESGGQRGHKA